MRQQLECNAIDPDSAKVKLHTLAHSLELALQQYAHIQRSEETRQTVPYHKRANNPSTRRMQLQHEHDAAELKNAGLISKAQLQHAVNDPSSPACKSLLSGRYGITAGSSTQKLGRQVGTYSHHHTAPARNAVGAHSRGVYVLPKQLRDDPLITLPLPDDDELERGVLDLVHKGYVRPFLQDIGSAVTGSASGELEGVPAPGIWAQDIEHRASDALQLLQDTDHPGSTRAPMADSFRAAAAQQPKESVWDVVQEDESVLHTPDAEKPIQASRKSNTVSESAGRATTTTSARDYDELQDEHSLQNIIIRRGRIVKQTPEFDSLMRSPANTSGEVGACLDVIAHMCNRCAVSLAIVDGRKLARLVINSGRSLSERDLVSTICNASSMEDKLQASDVPIHLFPSPAPADGADVTPTVDSEHNQSQVSERDAENVTARMPTVNHDSAMDARLSAQTGDGEGNTGRSDSRVESRPTERSSRICETESGESEYAADLRFPLESEVNAAVRLQRAYRMHSVQQRYFALLADDRQSKYSSFHSLQKQLRKWWPMVKQRVEVHVPSLSIKQACRSRMRTIRLHEAASLGRIAASVSSSVYELIYVSACSLNDDTSQEYLFSLLGEQVYNKVRIIEPDMLNHMPLQVSLAKALWCSPYALRRIEALCRGKHAVLVPGQIDSGEDEFHISVQTNIPLLAHNVLKPNDAAGCLGSKSAARCAFSHAGVRIAYGCSLIAGESDPFEALVQQVYKHPEADRWLFKLDNELLGRGHAWLDMSIVPHADRVLHKLQQKSPAPSVETDLREVLYRALPRRITFPTGSNWTWEGFRAALVSEGGVLEAAPEAGPVAGSPKASVFVHPCVYPPTAEVELLSTHEQIFAPAYRRCGTTMPQSSVPQEALHRAATAVAQKLAVEHGAMGYLDIEFVAYAPAEKDGDASTSNVRIMGCDINATLSAAQSAHILLKASMMNASCKIPRCCANVELLTHPLLHQLQPKSLVERLKLNGFLFNPLHAKKHISNVQESGVLLTNVHLLSGNAFAALCFADSTEHALQQLRELLDFIVEQVGAPPEPASISTASEDEQYSHDDDNTFRAALGTVRYVSARLQISDSV